MARGEVKFRLVAEAEQARKALEEIRNQVGQLGQDFAGRLGPAGAVLEKLGPAGLAGAAGIGAAAVAVGALAAKLADATARAVEYGGKFQDLSDSTDIAAEGLQKLAVAGSSSGTSVESLAEASKKLQKSLVESPEKFAQLGLSVQQLLHMKPDAAFAAVTAQIAKLGTQAEKTAAAAALLGKGFDLKVLKTNIEEVGLRAERLGLVMSGDMIAALDDVGDEAGILSQTWDALMLNLGATIATTPGLKGALGGLTDELGKLVQWVKLNKDGIHEFTKVTIVPAIGVLKDLATAARNAGTAFAFLRSQAQQRGSFTNTAIDFGLNNLPFGMGAAIRAGVGLVQPGGRPGDISLPPVEGGGGLTQNSRPKFGSGDDDRAKKAHEAALRAQERIDKALQTAEQLAAVEGKLAEDEEAALDRELEARHKINDLIADKTEALQRSLDQSEEDADAAFLEAEAAAAAAEKLAGEQDEATRSTVDWNKALAQVADTFQVLGISADSTLGRVLGGTTAAAASIQNLQKGIAAGGGGLGGFFKGGLNNVLGNVTNALGAAGAAISIGKAVASLFSKSPAEKAAESAGKTLGLKVSKELAETIAKQSKSLGIGMSEASLLNLSKAMGESGKDPRAFGAQIGDLMNAIKLGAVPAAQGVAELGASFKLVAQSALDAGSVGDNALVGLIRRSKELGLDSAEIKAFMGQQLGEAAGGLGKVVGSIRDVGGTKLPGGIGFFSSDMFSQDAEDQATLFNAVFWATVKEQGPVAAGDAMRETFKALQEKLEEFGGAANADAVAMLSDVGRIMDLTETSAQFRAAAEGASGLEDVLAGLANTGYLTRDSFSAVQRQAAAAFTNMTEGGATSAEAFQAIAPLLNSIVSASGNYGIALDEQTKAMIAQAKEAGVAFKAEPIDRMAAAMDRAVIALEKMAGITGTVAGNFGAIERAAGGLPSRIPSYGLEGPGIPMENIPRLAGGGYVPPRPGGTLAVLGEGGRGEFVVPDGGGGRGPGSVTIHMPITMTVDASGSSPEFIGTAVVRAIRDNVAQLRDAVQAAARQAVVT